MNSSKTIIRTAEVRLRGSCGKTEALRYAHSRYTLYTKHFIQQLFFNHYAKFVSTKGMGLLANQAQQKAIAMVNSSRALQKLGIKVNVPDADRVQMHVAVEADKGTGFDYWVSTPNPFGGNRPIRLPAHKNKQVKNLEKRGFKVGNSGEVFWRGKQPYCRVFFKKEVIKRPALSLVNIGVDVGWHNSVATSTGYLGRSLRAIAQRVRQKTASRQRQGLSKKSRQTYIKQVLNREAKKLVSVALAKGVQTLVLESQAVIGNLVGRGLLGKWARSHFHERAKQLAAEHGLGVLEVNPRNTSRRCSRCGFVHGENRNGKAFRCRRCGFAADADLNAAFNISGRGRALALRFIHKAKLGARKINANSNDNKKLS